MGRSDAGRGEVGRDRMGRGLLERVGCSGRGLRMAAGHPGRGNRGRCPFGPGLWAETPDSGRRKAGRDLRRRSLPVSPTIAGAGTPRGPNSASLDGPGCRPQGSSDGRISPFSLLWERSLDADQSLMTTLFSYIPCHHPVSSFLLYFTSCDGLQLIS